MGEERGLKRINRKGQRRWDKEKKWMGKGEWKEDEEKGKEEVG